MSFPIGMVPNSFASNIPGVPGENQIFPNESGAVLPPAFDGAYEPIGQLGLNPQSTVMYGMPQSEASAWPSTTPGWPLDASLGDPLAQQPSSEEELMRVMGGMQPQSGQYEAPGMNQYQDPTWNPLFASAQSANGVPFPGVPVTANQNNATQNTTAGNIAGWGNQTSGSNDTGSGSGIQTMGNSNTSYGNSLTITGNNNQTAGNNDTVSGNANTISGSANRVSGSSNSVSNNNDVVVGSNDTVTGQGDQVYANGLTVSASNVAVFTDASGDVYTVAADGSWTETTSGGASVASGGANTAKADGILTGLAIAANQASKGGQMWSGTGFGVTPNAGNSATVNAANSVEGSMNSVVGSQNTVSGNANTVSGSFNSVTGSADSVFGQMNTVAASGDTVYGSSLTVHISSATVFGDNHGNAYVMDNTSSQWVLVSHNGAGSQIASGTSATASMASLLAYDSASAHVGGASQQTVSQFASVAGGPAPAAGSTAGNVYWEYNNGTPFVLLQAASGSGTINIDAAGDVTCENGSSTLSSGENISSFLQQVSTGSATSSTISAEVTLLASQTGYTSSAVSQLLATAYLMKENGANTPTVSQVQSAASDFNANADALARAAVNGTVSNDQLNDFNGLDSLITSSNDGQVTATVNQRGAAVDIFGNGVRQNIDGADFNYGTGYGDSWHVQGGATGDTSRINTELTWLQSNGLTSDQARQTLAADYIYQNQGASVSDISSTYGISSAEVIDLMQQMNITPAS